MREAMAAPRPKEPPTLEDRVSEIEKLVREIHDATVMARKRPTGKEVIEALKRGDVDPLDRYKKMGGKIADLADSLD